MIDPTRVFLLRHGETAWNAEQRLQGHADVELNELGRWQARRLAETLAAEDVAALYSSDLRRALDTARALAEISGQPVHTDSALRERAFGFLEGLTYDEIDARFPEDALRWRRREPDFAPGGGETMNGFSARSLAAVTRLAAAHPGQAIAVFAHGGVLDCVYREALGLGLAVSRSWQLGNASINRLLFTGSRFTVLGWDDRGHLEPQPG